MVFCVEVKCDILVRMGIDRGCLGMMQGIIFRPVEEEVLEFGENYVMRNCMSCVLTSYYWNADFRRMRWVGLVEIHLWLETLKCGDMLNDQP